MATSEIGTYKPVQFSSVDALISYMATRGEDIVLAAVNSSTSTSLTGSSGAGMGMFKRTGTRIDYMTVTGNLKGLFVGKIDTSGTTPVITYKTATLT